MTSSLRRITVALIVGASLSAPLLASAQSVAELQAQIQALRAQLEALLAARQGYQPPVPPTPSSCVNVGMNLGPGATDAETTGAVTALQNYLIAKDLLAGPASGMYDDATKETVGQLQISLGILLSSSDPAYGFFGPRTRAATACSGRGSLVATPLSGYMPLSVTFTVTVDSGAIDYGDGNSEPFGCTTSGGCPSQTLTHTYSNPGTYFAKLITNGQTVGRATIVVIGTNSEGPRATIAPASLYGASANPTVKGTASKTDVVALTVTSLTASSPTAPQVSTVDTYEAPVINGTWSVILNKRNYIAGTYRVDVQAGGTLLTTGTLTVYASLWPVAEPLPSCQFGVTPARVSPGQEVTFTWTTSHAVSVSFVTVNNEFDFGSNMTSGLPPTGTLSAMAPQTAGIRTVTLDVRGRASDTQCQTTVNVVSPTTPVYRFFKASTGEHFFTTSESEGLNAGFTSEGIGFMVYGSQSAGMIPLYRCIAKYDTATGKHYTSTDGNCEGNGTKEGLYGYIHSSSQSGTVALKRYYHPPSGDHLTTTSPSTETMSGYTDEGTLGYVPVASSAASSASQLSQMASVLMTMQSILRLLGNY